ncbi:hypothetical protein [Bradyrhizobium sp. CCBAU 45394]|uniref:hypothetical protein n=1 Tax=Bradyrhizobium sp. CCBAU 45394 TaxID=1325087 RepID=UPI00230248A0|nr:hypothetical protein [Bradyrhizobium sp. CCBAU 45394]
MSGYLRLCFAGFALVAILSATPASSDPLTDFFNSARSEPAATSSAQADCLPRPGDSTGEGQHWVYRMDGHRKCWFLAEGIPTVKKPVRRPDENKNARRGLSAVGDARAELLRPARAERSQQTSPAPEVKVADAASGLATGTAPALSVPPVADLPSGQLMQERSVPRQVDVEKLLAAAPAANDAVTAGAPPAMPIGARIAEARDEAWSGTATWLGVLLLTLGGFSILSSSRTLRHAAYHVGSWPMCESRRVSGKVDSSR